MRVIVVEDNILFCDYICNFLQNADYQTVKAYRLAQAGRSSPVPSGRMTSCWPT